MIKITVSADEIKRMKFTFAEGSYELRAVNIIKGMNLKIFPDRDGVLSSIAKKEVTIVQGKDSLIPYGRPLEILLKGVRIYADEVLVDLTNKRLQEENFYKERELCTIQ